MWTSFCSLGFSKVLRGSRNTVCEEIQARYSLEQQVWGQALHFSSETANEFCYSLEMKSNSFGDQETLKGKRRSGGGKEREREREREREGGREGGRKREREGGREG